MRIVIDLQAAQAAHRLEGIGRYSLSLAQAIARNRGDHEIVLALSGLFPETVEPLRAKFDGLLPQDKIRVWHAPGPVAFHDAHNSGRRLAAESVRETFLASLEPDLVHVGSWFEGYSDDVVSGIGRFADAFPTAVTLHDDIAYVSRDHSPADPRPRDWYYVKGQSLRHASLFTAVSESARRDAVARLSLDPKDIVTIPNAVDPRFTKVDLDTAARNGLLGRHGIVRRFVMCRASDEPQDTDRLVRAYAGLPVAVRHAHQLAIAGLLSQSRQDSLRALAAGQGLSLDEMVLVQHLPDSDLAALLNVCALFVFPSRPEGLPMPVVEAMSCGAPVIASNTIEISEVIGRTDPLFDPLSERSMTATLSLALTDDRFRAELARYGLERARGYSWEEGARRAVAAFERLHTSRPGRQHRLAPRSRRPRLAYVSPLPPDRSGIADYSAELLPVLSQHYDIELVTSNKHVRQFRSYANMPLRTPKWLRANARRLDRVLYHFGNSSFHAYMFDLLADVPGTVLLHDFFLSGILANRELSRWGSRVWTRALYESHGYAAVRERFRTKSPSASEYPANLPVLRQAVGVIVHSNYSRDLARRWYGPQVADDFVVVPHLRTPASGGEGDALAARTALGLAPDTFLVCCFGILGPIKLNHRALRAWLISSLGADQRCRLLFVGENDGATYGAEMRQAIKSSGAGDRVRITGWTEPDLYRHYLAAADVALQLRFDSRGETSGTVLDCMNHGVPTIVNACGAMAELPADSVWMLPETFDDTTLAAALEALRGDPARRAALGARGREVIRTRHDPRACADGYAKAMEQFYARSQDGVSGLVEAIATLSGPPNDAECKQLAASIARNHPAVRAARRLFFDVSALIEIDLRTGIQRVVRSVLLALLDELPAGIRVEPVYAPDAAGYRYARRFMLRLCECPAGWATDDLIDPQFGDIFLAIDLNYDATMAQSRRLDEYRAVGVAVYHVVHDLLPLLRPECFPPGTDEIYARWLGVITRFDGIIAVSRAVADELLSWLAVHGPARSRPLKVAWSHHGADIEKSVPTRGMPSSARRVLDRLRSVPSFLVVGTLEPRKGHAQTLSAFERLWSAGIDVRLVFVGKNGWMSEELVQRIRRHPEIGTRLFWLKAISDEYLEAVYAASTCLIASSEGEGFGLPVIEAARHDLPIIARDIPVFREVAGPHAVYFDGLEPGALAAAVTDWLALFRSGKQPRSSAVPWLTWEQSTRNLLDIILHDRWPATWMSDSNRDAATSAPARESESSLIN